MRRGHIVLLSHRKVDRRIDRVRCPCFAAYPHSLALS
jgi:hypothetical protein